MIPIDQGTFEPDSTALRRIEGMLRAGTLAAAAEQARLGESLANVGLALAEADLHRRLAALVPAAAHAGGRLASRADVTRRLREIKGVAISIHDARTQDELDRLSERIRLAAVKADSLHRDLNLAWEGWITDQFETTGRLAALLERFSGTRAVGESLKRCSAEGLTLKNRFPPTAETVERACVLIEAQHGLIGELRVEEDTKALLVFLDRVMDRSATLEHVTPQLTEWLRAYNALGLLKVAL